MLGQLKSQHREIARLHVEGLRPADIAREIGMNVQSVGHIIRDPLCQAHIQKLMDRADGSVIDVRKRLAEMNTKALDKIDSLLDSEKTSDSVALRAAQDVLDRNGYSPVTTTQHVHAHLTSDEIKALQQRAIANGAMIVDGEYDEDD